MTQRPSIEVAAKATRRLADESAGTLDLGLGDPPSGRSALDAMRTKPPESSARRYPQGI
jgi:hypothetical protein